MSVCSHPPVHAFFLCVCLCAFLNLPLNFFRLFAYECQVVHGHLLPHACVRAHTSIVCVSERWSHILRIPFSPRLNHLLLADSK